MPEKENGDTRELPYANHFYKKLNFKCDFQTEYRVQGHLVYAPFNPTQPNPTQPNPTQPNPTQPNPTQPNPTQPNPTQPNPTQPNPTQPNPTQPNPTQPNPNPTQPNPTLDLMCPCCVAWLQSL